MKKRQTLVNVCFLLLVAVILGWSQQNPPQQSAARGKVIELGKIKIDARIELPQVQIIDKRMPPKFKEVKAEKDFGVELAGGLEGFRFKAITSGKVEQIKNIKELLNRKRF